jgi:AcrR family transcriptional regulator
MARPQETRVALTDENIAKAALWVLDQEGPAALSFRRIGTELGTSHMAVHRYCGNFDGLLGICAEHAAAGLPDIEPALPWSTSTELRFTALYEILSAHWGLVAMQRGRPWLGPEMMRRFAEPAVAASIAAGLTPEQVSACQREFYVYTVGSALTRNTFSGDPGPESMATLDATHHPVLTRHRESLRDSRSDREMFVHGIRTLIKSWDPQYSKT